MTDDSQAIERHLRGEAEGEPPLEGLIEALREGSDESLRLVVHFTGEGHEVLFAREDVRAAHGDAFDEHVEWLVLKALSDPHEDDAMATYGELDATVRWFEEAVVTVYPTGEWRGVVSVLDRRDSPLVDAVVERLS